MSILLRKSAIAVLAVWIVAAPASADTIQLDQSFAPPEGGVFHIINECCAFAAQTYTAGISGTLAGIAIDVESNRNFPIHVSVRPTAGGVPAPTILGEVTLPVSTSPLSNVFGFPDAIDQIAGEQYAIVVSFLGAPPPGPGQGLGHWRGSVGYPGGAALASIDGSRWFSDIASDANFQTYVAPIPEPSTLLLVLTGSLAVTRLRRRTKEG